MLYDVISLTKQQWEDSLGVSIATPKLKYYMHSYASDIPVQYFVVLGKKDKRGLHVPIAMAELKRFQGESHWSLPYISVDPKHANRSMGRQVYRTLCEWLKKEHPQCMLRSSSSSESGAEFQHVADTECFRVQVHKCSWMTLTLL